MKTQRDRLIKFCSLLFLMLINNSVFSKSDIYPVNLKTEYKTNPFIDDVKPRLSWELESVEKNQYQSAYQILVSSSPEKLSKNQGDLWNSGVIKSSKNNQIEYKGKLLVSGQQVWWKVKSWDVNGKEGVWSDVNTWEMAKLDTSDWNAKWIGYNTEQLSVSSDYHLPPSPYLRTEEIINKPIKKARLYISSLGLHEFYINGKKIGDEYFGSGWTDYNKRVYYHVYDVTDNLKVGNNAFGAILSNGWYAGYLGYALLVGTPQVRQFYGEFPLLKAQVDIEFLDGSRKTIKTDEYWKAKTGGVIESDFLHGEKFDARKAPVDWNEEGFDMTNWDNVVVNIDVKNPLLQLYPGEPIRIIKELPVVSITKRENDKYIIDFGQNFAGNIRLSVLGESGDSLVFRFGEMLHPDGSLVTENLRKARATDTYILSGDPKGEVWSPKFTYHGFQYVEVTGLKAMPDSSFLVGLVMTSDLNRTGEFVTDNKMINQLYSNIVWTQWANYFDIPTDCPQRDERLGWTGDAQIYIKSSKFNNDIASFYKKWIRDLNDAQWSDGSYPIYAPMPEKDQIPLIRKSDTYSPGWSDAGIICPYEIYQSYGDTRIVKEAFSNMIEYMDFLKEKSSGHFLFIEDSFNDIKGGFGDWLSIGNRTSPDLLATIYYYYCSKIMAEMSFAIGEQNYGERFENESNLIKENFKKYYLDQEGRFIVDDAKYKEYSVEDGVSFSGHTQTAYANAIYFNILDQEDLLKCADHLKHLVDENDGKLTTGFLGFKPLLPALSTVGAKNKAYNIFLSTEYPSLGYEVVNGATSIWERWDSYVKDVGFVHNAAMNSFSHYAFGSVNEWMFENIAGIKLKEIGYKSFIINPEIPNEGLNEVYCTYHSIQGQIESSWHKKETELIQKIKIPVNTKAFCHFPTENTEHVWINGIEVNKNNDVISLEIKNGQVVIELGSGEYNVVTKLGK